LYPCGLSRSSMASRICCWSSAA